MKKVIFLFGFTILIFFWGCSENGPVNSPKSGESGKVALSFDKLNAPAGVVNIKATLNREGFTTVSGNLNIQSDTSATLLLTGLDVGTWHLVVEASDSANVVIYTGAADILIQAGLTTQVALTLQPTGSGTGDVFIQVIWGTPPRWVDYYLNPILRKSSNGYDMYGVWQPKIIIENGSFKMWYTNMGASGVGAVGYAVSSNGLEWTKPVIQPVLLAGTPSAWDSYSVSAGPVIKVDNIYRMYYTGNSGNDSKSHIGLATSPDGIVWTKFGSPVLMAGNTYDYQIAATDIIKVNSLYYLYYSAKNFPYYYVCLATSSDGINWNKHPQNPILTASETWEGSGVYHGSVKYFNGTYYMTYQNVKDILTAFGMAYSTDGITWNKDSGNPFFTQNNTHNNWVGYICYPELEVVGNQWWVYYSGMNTAQERFVAVVRK